MYLDEWILKPKIFGSYLGKSEGVIELLKKKKPAKDFPKNAPSTITNAVCLIVLLKG